MPISDEENYKLLAAYCVLRGDTDQIAEYMGITKNAVMKRYAKLVAAEKEKIEQAGYGVPPLSGKKRPAPPAEADEGTPTKKGKKANVKATVGEMDDSGIGEEIEEDIKHGDAGV